MLDLTTSMYYYYVCPISNEKGSTVGKFVCAIFERYTILCVYLLTYGVYDHEATILNPPVVRE